MSSLDGESGFFFLTQNKFKKVAEHTYNTDDILCDILDLERARKYEKTTKFWTQSEHFGSVT